MHPFTIDDFPALCDMLATQDASLQTIINHYGYPPFWSRPNNFETLVHIILEQQVSLASAKAALEKLRQRIGDITPENVLALSDDALKAAYFSRQKTVYVRHLSQSLLSGRLNLDELALLPDDIVRQRLVELKGIGNWTADIYLIMVLHRPDIFPFGDLAAVNALRRLKNLPKDAPHEHLLNIVEQWQPYRTIATMLLWHNYLSQPRARRGAF